MTPGDNPPSTPPASRRIRGRAALLVIVAALAIFGLASASWFSAVVPGAVQGDVAITVSGADAAPVLGGVALVLLAAGAALGLVGPAGRRVVGVVVAFAGVAGAVLTVLAVRDPSQPVRAAVADATGVGQVPAEVATSPVAWVAVSVCLAVAVLGGWHAAGRGAWSKPGARHDRAAEAPSTGDLDGALDDPTRAWDALSDGTDPS